VEPESSLLCSGGSAGRCRVGRTGSIRHWTLPWTICDFPYASWSTIYCLCYETVITVWVYPLYYLVVIAVNEASIYFVHRATFSGYKGKAIPLTGRGGPWGSETSRRPHYLDSLLTDGGEVISLTSRPPYYLQEESWYSFLLETESTSGL
jgi:hypothetical protein